MMRSGILAVLITIVFAGGAYAAPASAMQRPDAVDVFVAGELFTTYKHAGEQKYPYFFPVNGPRSNVSVTTETTEPYPHHHSLFFGCDKVNGGNYWQEGLERGQIVSQGPEIAQGKGGSVVIEDTCLWRQPGEEPIIREERTIRVSAPNSDTRYIDFETVIHPLVDIEIERTNHSLFSARMRPELSVEQGGTLVNAGGDSGEKETFGVSSPWCDYSGTHEDVTEGLAILQWPENPGYPFPWFTRNYGFFSPTPLQWIEESPLRMSKGEALTLRFRVVVHGGNVEDADISAHFARYCEEAAPQN